MAEAEASLILRLKDLATDQLKKFGSELEKMGDQLEKSKFLWAGAFGSLVAGIGFSLKAFAEEELAVRSLSQALANQGKFTRETTEDLVRFAGEMQNLSTFSDDSVISVQSQLVSFGLLGDQLKETTRLTLDLAAAKGIDLNSAANLIGKAFAGETSMLSRYGIVIDESIPKTQRFAEVTKLLSDRFGGSALAQQETFTGSLAKLKNTFSDTAEKIGQLFAPAVTRGIEALTALLKRVQEADPQTKALALVVVGFAAAFTGVLTAVSALVAFWPTLMAAFGVILGPVGLITAALLGLSLTVYVVRDSFTELGRIASEVMQGLLNSFVGLGQAWQMMIDGNFIAALQRFKDAAADAVIAVGLGIQQSTTATIDAYKKQYEALVKFVKDKQGLLLADLTNVRNAQKTQEELEFEAMKKRAEANQQWWQQRVDVANVMLNQLRTIGARDMKALFYIEKASALANAIMNTATGVTKALALGPIIGPPLAGLIQGLGAIQIGVIAGTAVGFAEGGMVMPTAGGTIGRIGEAGSREAVIPLDDTRTTDAIRDALGGGGDTHVHIHAGVIVADDASMRELARRIDEKLLVLKQARQTVSI